MRSTILLSSLSLLFPAAVLGQGACSIGENWGNLLATFTAEGAATTLQVVGTITIQTGCPSSFRAYQTIELGPSLSCFAEPVVLTMDNVTNVHTVTYTYQECPVITDAVSPTITVNESHWIQTDSEDGSVFGATSSIVTLPSRASSAVATSSAASGSASAGASVTSPTPTSSPTPITMTTSTTTDTGITATGTTGTQTDNILITESSSTGGANGPSSTTKSIIMQVSAASRGVQGALVMSLAFLSFLGFLLLDC